MKKVSMILTILFIFSMFSVASAETRGKVILMDTAYGALTGAIIGSAFLIFKDDPEDHLEYISYGAGIGAIAGALYGVYEATALVEFDKNSKKVKIAMPTVKNMKKGAEFVSTVDIFKVRY